MATKTKSHRRAGLLLVNLIVLGAPAVAMAGSTEVIAGVRAVSCLSSLVGGAMESSTPTKLADRGARAQLHGDLRGRCLINEITDACRDKATEVAADGSVTGKMRSLVYRNKACDLGDAAACLSAERVARSIGCADARSCDTPTGKPLGAPFSKAAARTSFADATDLVVTECENDTTMTEVRVTVAFAPDGTAHAVTVPHSLDDLLLGACLEQRFAQTSVPPFEGETTSVTMKIPLDEVPSAYHLVDDANADASHIAKQR